MNARPIDALAGAVKALSLPQEAMDRAAASCGGSQRAARLHREWLNDVISLPEGVVFSDAVRNPVLEFERWLDERLRDPHHLSHRALKAARLRIGPDAALLLASLRWRQEIAWARRMRDHPDDRIACLAGVWLAAAEREPARLFATIVSAYVLAFDDPDYRDGDLHDLTVVEIARGTAIRPAWTPLWLRSAEIEFGGVISSDPVRLRAAAKQVRGMARADALQEARRRKVVMLGRVRPVLGVSVLVSLVGKGMSSDDIVMAEADFVKAVQDGRVECDPSSDGSREFLLFAARWSGAAPPPDPVESMARRSSVAALSLSWIRGLPDSWKAMGSGEARNIREWSRAIFDGGRLPPRDPLVDYGVWLVSDEEAGRRRRTLLRTGGASS